MAAKTAAVSWMGVRVDWRARPPAWVAINIAIITAAVTGLFCGMAWDMLAVIVLGSGSTIAAAVSTPKPITGGHITWRAACVMAATIWATGVTITGTGLIAWGTGAGATAVGVAGSLLLQQRHRAAELARLDAAVIAAAAQAAEENLTRSAGEIFDGHNTDRTAYGANWVARIERVCSLKVKIPRMAVWESGVGVDLYVELPVGGATPADIRKDVLQLAADANLPRGCSVVVAEGDEGQRIAYLSISHVNTLRDDIEAPTDNTALTIYDPITMGKFADASPADVDLREQSLIVVGMKGSGKTNLLRVITRELMRRPDTLIWCMDIGGGGGLVRDLMRPFYDGRVDRAPIDWPILDIETAEYALDALLGIIPARKRIYDTTNLHPTWHAPQIMLITDELGNVPGHLKTKLVQCSDLGRASAHQQINCALRGIESYIPNDLVVQSAEAVVLGVRKEGEAQYVFDWEQRIKIGDIKGNPGRGLTRRRTEDGEGAIEQFKIPHLVRDDNRDDLADAAIALNHLRPTLDTPSADIANQISKGRYARRFDLAAPLLWDGAVPVNRAEFIEPTGNPEHDAHRRTLAEFDDELAGKSTSELLDMLDTPIDASHGDSEPHIPPPTEPPKLVSAEEAAELEALLDGAADTRDHIISIVLDADVTGTVPALIRHNLSERGITISPRQVRRVLAQLVKEGILVSPAEGEYMHARYQDRQ